MRSKNVNDVIIAASRWFNSTRECPEHQLSEATLKIVQSKGYASFITRLCKKCVSNRLGCELDSDFMFSKHCEFTQTSTDTPEQIGKFLDCILNTEIQIRINSSKADAFTNSFVHDYPAYELSHTQFFPRHQWEDRWRAAGDSIGWRGACQNRMIALRISPIWNALGDGVGGFFDSIGVPYPPFAFGCNVEWTDVPRKLCVELGLLKI